MEKVIDVLMDKTNLILGGIVTIMSAIFGGYWYLFLGFLILNIVDYVTGSIKARVLKKSSSAVGAKGILKKISYWVVIAIAFFVAQAFIGMGNTIGMDLTFLSLLGWLVLASYLINEIRSILENLVALDVYVPEVLIKGLEITAKLVKEKEDISES